MQNVIDDRISRLLATIKADIRRGFYVEAIHKLSRAIYINENHAELYQLRLDCHLQVYDLKSAWNDAKKLMKMQPNGKNIQQLSAICDAYAHLLLEVGDFEFAALALGEAIEIDKLSPGLYFHRYAVRVSPILGDRFCQSCRICVHEEI